jgi:methylated-DNA-[protein]-cysteine S-methyltransferase
MNHEPVSIGSTAATELGRVWVAVSERGLTTVEFGVERARFEASLRRQRRRETHQTSAAVRQMIDAAACQIAEYLQGNRRLFELPIDWLALASEFQRAALKAVAAIPYGEIRTYGQIAAEIGYPRAPRAVGRANATNPMPLVIPCHRVIGSDGKLHGYGGAGGLKTKRWLLELEGAHLISV